jgi:DNA-binding winged helix-turn-helix (wHTH) protein
MQFRPIVLTEHRESMRRDGPRMTRRQTSPAAADRTIEFGRFRLLPRRRQLLADGAPVELGTRAFDLLMALVEADGALVTKKQLQALVWPDIFVEETNLKVQISALRKALGEGRDFIQTETGRGYRFTAAIRSTAAAPERWSALDATAAPAQATTASPPDLSAVVSRLACLEAKLAEAVQLFTTDRTASKRYADRFPPCTASSRRTIRWRNPRDKASLPE